MDDPVLTYIVNHVFMPPRSSTGGRPGYIQRRGAMPRRVGLCASLSIASSQRRPQAAKWDAIIKMLQNFEETLDDTPRFYESLQTAIIDGDRRYE